MPAATTGRRPPARWWRRAFRRNPRGAWKDWCCRRLLRRSGIAVELAVDTFCCDAGSGSWAVATAGLAADSVVYSVGVGADVVWDLAMIERFGVRVHAFDPTPATVAWLRGQALPADFVFAPVGLAAFDGEQRFAPPRRTGRFDYRPLARGAAAAGAVACPVRRLPTLLAELGHDHVDVLKLDIEGGEYDLVDDLIAVAPRQLLVEFHHRFDGAGFDRTRDALARLRAAGYAIFWISRRGKEFGLLRR